MTCPGSRGVNLLTRAAPQAGPLPASGPLFEEPAQGQNFVNLGPDDPVTLPAQGRWGWGPGVAWGWSQGPSIPVSD